MLRTHRPRASASRGGKALRVCDPLFCANRGQCSVSAVTGTDPTCSCPTGVEGARCTETVRSTSAALSTESMAGVIVGCVVAGILIAVGIAVTTVVMAKRRDSQLRQHYLDSLQDGPSTTYTPLVVQ